MFGARWQLVAILIVAIAAAFFVQHMRIRGLQAENRALQAELDQAVEHNTALASQIEEQSAEIARQAAESEERARDAYAAGMRSIPRKPRTGEGPERFKNFWNDFISRDD